MLNNRIIGLVCIIAGLVILFLALGNFLFRLILALLSWSLINYGLHLRGEPPVIVHIIRLKNMFW